MQGYSQPYGILAVGRFAPQPAIIMEHDFARLDVVQKSIGAQTEPRLAFTGRKS
jgi:hypothetical protein